MHKEVPCNFRKTPVLTYMEINTKGKQVCWGVWGEVGRKILEAKRKWKHGNKTVWGHRGLLDGFSMTPVSLEAERQMSPPTKLRDHFFLIFMLKLCPDCSGR